MKKKAVMSILACIMCIGIAAGCSNTGIMAVTDNTAISQIETSGEKISGATETGASDHEGLSVEEAMEADYEEISLDGMTGTVSITKGGTYLVTGSSDDCQICINVDEDDSVVLILDDATICSASSAAIYAESAKEVYLVLKGESSLSNGGSFDASETSDISAVIESKDDLYISCDGSLMISSPSGKGISVNDSLVIYGGELEIEAGDDGINVNEDFVYAGDTLYIKAGDDAIHADALLQIDGGTINAEAAEGLEATGICIDDGNITINATDDGINAAQKVTDMDVYVEINGGNITIVMGQGDTDGIDSNGDLIINGGTIDITGQSACDYDGKAELNGGTLIVNGEEVTQISNQFMGGGFMQHGDGAFMQRPDDGEFAQQPADGEFPQRPDGGEFAQQPADGEFPQRPDNGGFFQRTGDRGSAQNSTGGTESQQVP